MNKKISTLFTAGLLVAGSLCGSAWAEKIELPIGDTPLEEVKSGAEVFMAIDDNLYGFVEKSGTTIKDGVYSLSTPTIDDGDLAKYVWKVTTTQGASEIAYTLTNKATGDVLRVNKNGTPKVELNTAEKTENTVNLFLFLDAADKSVSYDGNTGLLTAVIGGQNYEISWSATAVNNVYASVATAGTNTGNVQFYAVTTSSLTDAAMGELNALYNGSGFSFGAKTPDTKELVGNLFGDQNIVAVYTNGVTIDETYPSYAETDGNQSIPGGLYFFTENAPVEANGTVKTDYAAWMNGTVIAVSSTDTIASITDRSKAKGFTLTTMKIKDMNLYTGTKNEWKSQGNEISIYNACFAVEKTYIGDYPYALSLNKFRYKTVDAKAGHSEKANVRLNVVGGSSNNYLVTEESDNHQFIFKLAASGMIKGIDLLNKEEKAAVYNIRVLDGIDATSTTGEGIDKDDIESAYGKYLTVYYDEQGRSLEFAAKAKVLAMENTPAYQWVITEVKDNDVTFTNRETDVKFTTKLFPVEGQANVYELAVASNYENKNVTPIYVNQNTYNETAGDKAKLNKLVIELSASEVDPYAGFLNVEDKTLVTMAFARDNNDTSNKWYAAVNESNQLWYNESDAFTNDASDAAQWQLIKNKDSLVVIERSFVYNNNGHVTVKAKADVAYAYQYKLQYITDGEENGELFWDDNDRYSNNGYVDGSENLYYADVDDLDDFENNDPRFIIKQNADGSIYLIQSNNLKVNTNAATIFDEDIKPAVYVYATESNNQLKAYYFEPSSIYAVSYLKDKTLHTYLIEEAPEVSYPAEEGYVYMQSEKGDYISMNEDYDGILVDENPFNLYLHVADTNALVPSFYISKGIEGSAERAYLFHPQDSVDYYAAVGEYNREYEWVEGLTKAIFKVGTINASRDTIATMIKGEMKNVAVKADDEGTFGGLKDFKVQIVLAEDSEDQYIVRSLTDNEINKNGRLVTERYLYAVNGQLTWTENKEQALKLTITEGDPTANETIANEVEGVKVIAGNGSVEIQGAAGKNVVIANILGKVVASTTLTSDNQTINVPAGIVVVTVDGEAVKAVVR